MNRNSEQTTSSGRSLLIHDRASISIEADCPSMHILSTMFAPFVTDAPVHEPDIIVSGNHPAIAEPSYAEHDLRYDDRAVWLAEIDVQITVDDSRFVVSGSRELLTSVLPVVDVVTARRGAAMVHATMVEIDGRGVLMPAWGGVGKTSTMAKLLRNQNCHFMGDDWGFLSADGDLLGYAKPMFIKPHHRPIYPHLFAGARKPLVPKVLSRPVGRITTRVHPVVTRFPKVASKIRRWSPEHKMVTPQQAFPDTRMVTSAPLAVAVFVERYSGANVSCTPQSTSWMVDRLVGNFYSEMAAQSREVLTALTATGLVPLHRVQADKADVVRKGLGSVPCQLLRVPAQWSADRASDAISEHLMSVAVDPPASG